MSKIDELLANPQFDVEQFISNVNIHEKSQAVMNSLLSDPHIFLSIAEGDDYEICERHPQSPEDFYKLKGIGLETWTKKTTSGNLWYGVIAHKELAVSYRRVQYNREVEVWRGENASENAKARWKQIKMHKVGEESTYKKPLQPGERPIDYIREEISKLMEPIAKNRYRRSTDSYMSFELPSLVETTVGHNRYSYYGENVPLRVFGRGSTGISVKTEWDDPNATPNRWGQVARIEKIASFTRKIDKNNFKTAEAVATEIVEWFKENNPKLKKHLEGVANASV